VASHSQTIASSFPEEVNEKRGGRRPGIQIGLTALRLDRGIAPGLPKTIAAYPLSRKMCKLQQNNAHRRASMRTSIEIADVLMAEAQNASGATKKQTVEAALRLLVQLRRQRDVNKAFGKYRWRGNLARSREGRRLK
jgi:Arc/MetJ family transcription regulator